MRYSSPSLKWNISCTSLLLLWMNESQQNRSMHTISVNLANIRQLLVSRYFSAVIRGLPSLLFQLFLYKNLHYHYLQMSQIILNYSSRNTTKHWKCLLLLEFNVKADILMEEKGSWHKNWFIITKSSLKASSL